MEKYNLQKLREDLYLETELSGNQMKFSTTLGIFSPREIDEGSKLFIENMEIKPDDITLDLGCGYGAIGLTIAKLSPRGQVQMVDKDFVSVEYANKNAKLNGLKNAKAYLSNGFSNVPPMEFDNIISNLPAHIGNDFLYLILNDAKQHLKQGGTIQVVTISRLRKWIKRHFEEVFGNYTKVKQGRMHTVSMAIKEN